MFTKCMETLHIFLSGTNSIVHGYDRFMFPIYAGVMVSGHFDVLTL